MKRFIPDEIFTNSPSPVCILEGPDHIYTFSNNAYDHLINSCNLMNRSVKEVSPELIGQKYISTLDEVYATGEAYHGKEVQLLINAEDVYKHLIADISCYPLLDANKRVYGIFTQINDTTEAVELKNVLLMELHHRVKNNLAFIISLIQLQSNELKDQQHQLVLTTAQKRIRTIAKVHDLILNQQDLKTIPVQKLLWSLFDHGLNYFDTGQSMVTVDVDELFINVNQAIPLGLICNEIIGLLKNRQDSNCSVSINSDLSELPNIELSLTVKNAGKNPFGQNVLSEEKSFEAKLINILAMQLKAKIETITDDNSTTMNIRFTKADVVGSAAGHFI